MDAIKIRPRKRRINGKVYRDFVVDLGVVIQRDGTKKESGGVRATDNAVIPPAAGVDIAWRMKLTVYARKANPLAGQRDRLANLIGSEARFGMGCSFENRRERDVQADDRIVPGQ